MPWSADGSEQGYANSRLFDISKGAGLRNFAEILIERSLSDPAAIAYRFFTGSSCSSDELSYRALWEKAASLAETLRADGMRDQRVLLVCRSQKHFVIAFYACMLAGVIVVPTALPRRQVLQSRLQLLVDDAGIKGVISDSDDLGKVVFDDSGRDMFRLDMREFMRFERHSARAEDFVFESGIDYGAIAFLQYTSGSTGKPKGVVVSHHNLMSNCASIQDAMQISSASSTFFALPLFHDMGLVGGVLQPMFSGCTANLMPPAEFVQYPERWLQVMSAYRITIGGGPNFMYEHALKAIADSQCEGVDLTAWRVACCGAEPIRPETFAGFCRRFEPLGFQSTSFYPCYGLAESTLFVSGPRVGDITVVAQGAGTEQAVSCGRVWGDMRVEIVDQHLRRKLPEGEVGEIWVAGGSVAQGYWLQSEQTEATFEAKLEDDGSTNFLRTGDLGFLQDGNLFVTGRIKDLIILYGKKYAPQDLEFEAERSHHAMRLSGSAAFCIAEEGAEKLILVCEVNREWLRRPETWSEIVQAVRASVWDAYSVQVGEVMLVKPGALPRTSSGKLRRQQCRSDYQAGNIEQLGDVVEAAMYER